MSSSEVSIVSTGTANLASVCAAIERLGARLRIVDDAASVTGARHLVLPGVGAFGTAMEHLRERRLAEPLALRVQAGKPTLAICLGMQLLAEGSEESPGIQGLGILHGRITRFAGDLRVPQIGWNRVEPSSECRLIEPGFAYYANSYKLDSPPAAWAAAKTRYGEPFVAAIERGGLLACQFHPELSGDWGLRLLRQWLDSSQGWDAAFTSTMSSEGTPC